MPTILEQAKADVKAMTFTVGGTVSETGAVTGGMTFQRTLANGLGLTAYLRGWWHDTTVVARPSGAVAGAELTKRF